MIKGSPQAFKFTTPYNFDDITNIVAVFSQTNNTTTGMPITKYYNKSVTKVDVFPTTPDTSKVYYVGTKYYRYDSGAWVASDTQPTEAQVSGGAITSYPLGSDCTQSKTYKCGKSYYQYNPTTQKWDITTEKPSATPTAISQPDKDSIGDADKKKACVYNQKYYQYNGSNWVPADTIKSIKDVEYWDLDKTGTGSDAYDRGETYCALETYYKYVGNQWKTYGCNCIEPVEVYAWNDTVANSADKSNIYVLKEFFYEYNVITDEFVKTAKQEVYYKYESNAWKRYDDKPGFDVEYIGLWSEVTTSDTSKVYVCKNVYYQYNTTTKQWVGTDKMQFSVIEIDKFDSAKTYDTTKIYFCPTRYYQYNIAKSEWEEVKEIKEPKIEGLSYWTEPGDRDKTKVYLCGTTYYQYDSAKSKWLSSPKFNMQVVSISSLNQRTDQTKIYKCCPLYYMYKDSAWVEKTRATDVAEHDGFGPVDNEPRSFIVQLSAAETNLFNTQFKGRVQVQVRSSNNAETKGKIEYFTVYPSTTDEIFTYVPSGATEALLIFDAGSII